MPRNKNLEHEKEYHWTIVHAVEDDNEYMEAWIGFDEVGKILFYLKKQQLGKVKAYQKMSAWRGEKKIEITLDMRKSIHAASMERRLAIRGVVKSEKTEGMICG